MGDMGACPQRPDVHKLAKKGELARWTSSCRPAPRDAKKDKTSGPRARMHRVSGFLKKAEKKTSAPSSGRTVSNHGPRRSAVGRFYDA